MGRYYRLTQKITKEEADKIVAEMQENEKVHHVEISDDLKLMEVETDEDSYSEVMTKAINICRRIGHGCEIVFTRFAYERVYNDKAC